MGPPLTEDQLLGRGLVLLVLVLTVFGLGATMCVGAGLLAGVITLGAVGWPLLGQAAQPVHLRMALGVAVAGSLVTLWAS